MSERDKGLEAKVRPGSLDVRGQQVELFPFDAFSFDSPGRTTHPLVKLKAPWEFEIDARSGETADETIRKAKLTAQIVGENTFFYEPGEAIPTVTSRILACQTTYFESPTYQWSYYSNGNWIGLSGDNTSYQYSLTYSNAAWTNEILRIRCQVTDSVNSVSLYPEVICYKIKGDYPASEGWSNEPGTVILSLSKTYRTITLTWTCPGKQIPPYYYEINRRKNSGDWSLIATQGGETYSESVSADLDVEGNPISTSYAYRVRQVLDRSVDIQGTWSNVEETSITGILASEIAEKAIKDAKLDWDDVEVPDGHITETKIDDNAVTTPKIATNSVVSDKIASNSVLTEKLSVVAKEYVYNPTVHGSPIRNWGNWNEEGEAVSSKISYVDSGNDLGAMAILSDYATNNQIGVRSKSFQIDHNKIYRVKCRIRKSVATGIIYLGVCGWTVATSATEARNANVAGNQEFATYNVNRTYNITTANPYWYISTNNSSPVEYVDVEVFLVGANRETTDVPKAILPSGSTLRSIVKAGETVKHVSIRVLNWGNTNDVPTTVYVKHLSVTEVGAGQVVAENIVAGAITAGKISTDEIHTLQAQSPDYEAGISGWKIATGGNVEFNEGTFRGSVVIGSGSSGYANITDAPAEAVFPSDEGLEVYYSFDNGTAIDHSGNENHGVNTNTPTSIDGVSGKAYRFNGTDQRTLALAAGSLSHEEPISINFRFRVPAAYSWDTAGARAIFGGLYNAAGGALGLAASATNNQVYAYVRATTPASQIASAAKTIVRDTWYNAHIFYDGGNTKKVSLYIDGVLIGTSATAFTGTATFTNLYLAYGAYGGIPSALYVQCDIDEFRIATREYALAEIVGLYKFITKAGFSAANLDPGLYAATRMVRVSGEQVFKYGAGAATPTPEYITLTADLFGDLTAYDWEYWNGAAWADLSGTNSNQTYTLAHNNGAWDVIAPLKYLKVRCVSGDYSDQITLAKLYDGADGTDGTSVNIVGHVGDQYDLDPSYTGDTGDGFITDDTGHLWVWDGNDWVDVGEIRGPAGNDAYYCNLSNEAHTIACDADGDPLTGELGSTGKALCSIRAFKGTTELTAVAAGSTPGAGEFKYVIDTVSDCTADRNSNTQLYIATVSDVSGFALIRVYLESDSYYHVKLFTWSKSIKGATGAAGDPGDPGEPARKVDLTADSFAFVYDADGANPSPSGATITATAFNTVGTVYYRFLVNDVQVQHTTSSTYSYTPQADWDDMPDVIKVEIREGSTDGDVVGTDSISVFGVKPGVDGSDGIDGVDGSDGLDSIVVIITNTEHTLPAFMDGAVESYNNSGTNIMVYEGDTALTFKSGSGATINGTFVISSVAVSPTGKLTVGARSGQDTTIAVVADHSSMDSATDLVTITYTIQVKRLTGENLTRYAYQVIRKLKRLVPQYTPKYVGYFASAPTYTDYNLSDWYYNTTDTKFYLRGSAGWEEIVDPGSSIISPALNDLMYLVAEYGVSVAPKGGLFVDYLVASAAFIEALSSKIIKSAALCDDEETPRMEIALDEGMLLSRSSDQLQEGIFSFGQIGISGTNERFVGITADGIDWRDVNGPFIERDENGIVLNRASAVVEQVASGASGTSWTDTLINAGTYDKVWAFPNGTGSCFIVLQESSKLYAYLYNFSTNTWTLKKTLDYSSATGNVLFSADFQGGSLYLYYSLQQAGLINITYFGIYALDGVGNTISDMSKFLLGYKNATDIYGVAYSGIRYLSSGTWKTVKFNGTPYVISDVYRDFTFTYIKNPDALYVCVRDVRGAGPIVGWKGGSEGSPETIVSSGGSNPRLFSYNGQAGCSYKVGSKHYYKIRSSAGSWGPAVSLTATDYASLQMVNNTSKPELMAFGINNSNKDLYRVHLSDWSFTPGLVPGLFNYPVGAGIIERGMNVRGEWIKYSDGTLIQYGKKELSGNLTITAYLYSIAQKTHIGDLPIEFIDTNFLLWGNLRINVVNNLAGTVALQAKTTTTYAIREAWAYDYSASTRILEFYAIGRWK